MLPHTLQTFVKGYTFDLKKIKARLSIDDDKDSRIDDVIYKVLDFIDWDINPTCIAERCDSREDVFVIMLTADAMDDNREALEAKDLSPPRYLVKLAEVLLSGPEIFEFINYM